MEQRVFTELMRKHYGTTAARMAESLGGESRDSSDNIDHNVDAIEADNILVMAEQPTLINLVNLLLLEAIQQRASDVHIEQGEVSNRRRPSRTTTTSETFATSSNWQNQDYVFDEHC